MPAIDRSLSLIAGEFSLDAAWDEIRKVPMTAGGDVLGVNFASFEAWYVQKMMNSVLKMMNSVLKMMKLAFQRWRERAGINDPNIPVLPEFMVLRIEDKVRFMPVFCCFALFFYWFLLVLSKDDGFFIGKSPAGLELSGETRWDSGGGWLPFGG